MSVSIASIILAFALFVICHKKYKAWFPKSTIFIGSFSTNYNVLTISHHENQSKDRQTHKLL